MEASGSAGSVSWDSTRRCRSAHRRLERCALAVTLGAAWVASAGRVHAATITVDTQVPATSSSAADGKCSLAEAILAANQDTAVDSCTAGLGRDVIEIPAGTYEYLLPHSPSEPTQALPSIDSEVILRGPETGTVTLTFNAAVSTFRLFGITGLGRATFERLTFTRVLGPQGMLNYGELVIDGCTIQSNGDASNPGAHAFFENQQNGLLTVKNTRFLSNSGFSIHQADGTSGTIRVEDSEFTANRYTAIRASRTGELTITGSMFDQNTGSPPALYVRDGVTATVTDTRFIDNVGSAEAGAVLGDAPGALTISGSTFEGNRSPNAGAILCTGCSTLAVDSSTFAANEGASRGGAIYLNGGSGTATFRNTTFSGNTSDLGGAIYADLALSVVLNNVTIFGNTCRDGCGLFLPNNGNAGTFTLSNTIIAANGDRDCYTAGGKFLVSAGYNLVGNDSACTIASADGDQIGTAAAPIDPGLEPLGDNGGATATHALTWDSPALDRGSPLASGTGACESVDQVGTARPIGSACDIGAFEGAPVKPDGGAVLADAGAEASPETGAPDAAVESGILDAGAGGAVAVDSSADDAATGAAGAGTGGSARGGAGSGGMGTGGRSAAAGGSEMEEPGDAGPDAAEPVGASASSGGCGCHVGSSAGGRPALVLLGLAALLWRRRRV